MGKWTEFEFPESKLPFLLARSPPISNMVKIDQLHKKKKVHFQIFF